MAEVPSAKRHWHVHQLFHHLRLAGHGAQRDPVVEVGRGHSDNLLDRGRLVGASEDLHHHVHHLRHSNIKDRHRRHGHLDLRHAAPLNPLLRSGHGSQPVWPRAPELRHAVIVEEEVMRARLLGRGFLRNLAVRFTSYPPPAPVPVGRRGGSSRPGASRRLAVHVSRTGVTVALAASWRSLLRVQHWALTTWAQQTGDSEKRTRKTCLNLLLLLLLLLFLLLLFQMQIDGDAMCLSARRCGLIGKPQCRVTWEKTPKRLPRKTDAQLRDNRRSSKNDAKCVEKTQHRHHGELVEIMSRFKARTALRDTATRSINCAHFSILEEWRENASGLSSPHEENM